MLRVERLLQAAYTLLLGRKFHHVIGRTYNQVCGPIPGQSAVISPSQRGLTKRMCQAQHAVPDDGFPAMFKRGWSRVPCARITNFVLMCEAVL